MTEPRDEAEPTERRRDEGSQADSGDVDLSAAPPARYELDVDEPEAPAAAPKPERTVKGAVVLSARLAAGVIGVAVAAVTVGATVLLPIPTLNTEPPALTVSPVSAEQLRACAAPLLRLGDELGGQATSPSVLGEPELSIASSARERDVEESAIASTDEASGRGSDIVTVAAEGDDAAPLFAASTFQAIDRGDFRGAAAADCAEPSDDIWLVGGATTTGRTTLLTVVNPGEVAATVDITVFSDSGALQSPGASGIAIAPNSERIFSLAGLAPAVAAPVVRVQSTGALVAASLQQTTVRTLEAGGVDYVTATALPAKEAVIPGLVFIDHDTLEGAIVGEDYLDLRSALRIFVPGEEQGHAVLTMTPAGGGRAVDIDITLPGGRVTELPLGDFEGGTYSASITADVDFVAGARVATVGSTGANDFTWLPAVDELEGSAVVAVAPGSGARLHLVNQGDDAAEVSIEDKDGETTEVTVRAGGTSAVDVVGGEAYTLSGFDALSISVGFISDGTIAAHAVSPRAPTSTPMTIYP